MSESRDTTDNLINNEAKVVEDMRKAMRYVKDDLFYRVIDVYNDDALKEGAFFHVDFMNNFATQVTGMARHEPLDGNWRAYIRYLWQQMRLKKSYKTWLAMKRSNSYQAVQDRFFRKCNWR